MPAPPIDRAIVAHVAKLASLHLSDAEMDRFAPELERIVRHIEQLDRLDSRDVPPTAHVAVERAPQRPDEVVACLSREEVLSQAPEVDGDGFAVPAFME